MKSTSVKAVFISALLASVSIPAIAQEVEGETSLNESETQNEHLGLQEITVTASRREQTTLEIPSSLTALSGNELEHLGADSYSDYLAEAPGVAYNSNGFGRGVIIMRGVATAASSNGNLQPSTAQYIDDLPALNLWSAWTATDLRMVDIERVEILRGPQGTMFGSGSLGGAVRIITNQPDLSEMYGNITVGASTTDGGEESHDGRLMLNLPLVEDKLAMRVALYNITEGGYIDNIPRGEDDANGTESSGYRVSLRYAPTNDFDMRLTATQQSDYVGDSALTFYDRAYGDEYENGGINPAMLDTKLDIYNFTANRSFDFADLVWSTTYASRKSRMVQDMVARIDSVLGSGLNPDDYTDFIQHDYNTISHEVRFSSAEDSRLEWVVGAFHMRQDLDVTQVWDYNPDGYPYLDSMYLADSTQTALFGEATYHFTDQWAFSAGARWFDNEFRFVVPVYEGTHADNTGATTTPSTTTTEDGVTPRFSLSYTPSDSTNIYASVAQGYRVGQVNFGTSAGASDPISGEVVPLTFDPDSLWNYEIGLKSYFFDNQLRVDAAVFFIDWSDIQYTRFTASRLNYTGNAGDAESKGVELTLAYMPTDNLEIGGTVTYTDAKLTSIREGAALEVGARLPGTPEWAVSSYLEYSDTLSGDMDWFVRASHRYVSEQIPDLGAADDVPLADAYHLVNLRGGIDFGRYNVSVFADNILNSDAETLISSRTSSWDPARRTYRVRPMTIGASVSIDF